MKKILLILLSISMLIVVPACINKKDSSQQSMPPKAKKERKVKRVKKVKKVKTTTGNGYGSTRTEEVVTEDITK